MSVLIENNIPFSFTFSLLTKGYLGALHNKCDGLNIERYHYTLTIIYNYNGNLTQQQLADFFKIDKASVVRIIDYLVKQKLVNRVVNELDRRQHFLVTTELGIKTAKYIIEQIQNLNNLILKGGSDQDKNTFNTVINTVRNNLNELPSENYFLDIRKIKK